MIPLIRHLCLMRGIDFSFAVTIFPILNGRKEIMPGNPETPDTPEPSSANLPVPAGPRMEHDVLTGRNGRGRFREPHAPKQTDPGFTAQVLGGGEKRGLKGGPGTLEAAKSTYLRSEYSGPNDRRPKPGRITKTEI
jgi:hypothetical protein